MTEASKHTPGPWNITRHDMNACAYIRDADGTEIATAYGFSDDCLQDKDGVWGDQPRRDADARLIAAAPDLLAALKQIAKIGQEENSMSSAALRMDAVAHAAIAKAEGRANG